MRGKRRIAALVWGLACAFHGVRGEEAPGGQEAGQVWRLEPGQEGALQEALTRCQAGDTVFLAAGTHVLRETVRPSSRTSIRGEGMEKTRLVYEGTSPCVLIDLSQREEVEISHLLLDARHDPKVQGGIIAHNARKLHLHHVGIRDLVPSPCFGPHGIHFHGTNPGREKGVTDSLIESCHLKNIGVGAKFGSGIRLAWGSSRNRVENCLIEETGRGGIFADNGSEDVVIRDNTVTGSGGEGLGIEVWGGCERAVIEDNEIDHWLSVGGCSWCAARRNVISSATGTYKFCGIEGIGSHLVITDNRVEGGQKIGLSVSGKQSKEFVYWARNTVRECNQWGAQFQGEAGGIAYHYLVDCRFESMPLDTGPVWYPGDEGYGFRINGHCHHLTFELCRFIDNGRAGVQIVGEDVGDLRLLHCLFDGNEGGSFRGLEDGMVIEHEPELDVSFACPDQVAAGREVQFLPTGSWIQQPRAGLLWDLGDGPSRGEGSPRHTYERPGAYKVALIVWDREGTPSRAERRVVVTSGG